MFDKNWAIKLNGECGGTPDFSHFPINHLMAMSLGIHVYVEKPRQGLSIEVDIDDGLCREHNVVTPNGNKGILGRIYFSIQSMEDAGIIKDVTAIRTHMKRS